MNRVGFPTLFVFEVIVPWFGNIQQYLCRHETIPETGR